MKRQRKCHRSWTSSWNVHGSLWNSFPVLLSTTRSFWSASTTTSTPVIMATLFVTARRRGKICGNCPVYLIAWKSKLFKFLVLRMSVFSACIGCVLSCSIKEKTHSIWPHLWEKKLDFMNPLFKPDQSQNQGLLRPSTAPYCFKYARTF